MIDQAHALLLVVIALVLNTPIALAVGWYAHRSLEHRGPRMVYRVTRLRR